MRVFTIAQRPDLLPDLESMEERIWPEFMLYGDMSDVDDLFSIFDDYQFVYIDESEQVIAAGETIPFHWSGVTEEMPESMDSVMRNALAIREAAAAKSAPDTQRANYLLAIAALVDESARGQGMSRTILLEMKELARRDGKLGVLAPVRPTFKSKHLELSMDEYASLRREDGQLYDPWLRTHERLDAKCLGVAPRAFSVIAPVANWQRWTGITFEHSGAHVIPGAIVPVEIDLESNTGTYIEPSVWYLHSL
jgi:hypothetical protein